MLTTIIAFLVVFGLLVFVHEAGHFIAARKSGMAVEEFGFGFPPRLIGIQRIGRRWRVVRRPPTPAAEESDRPPAPPEPTIYSINWIPLGGFVRIRGESGGDAADPASFAGQPRWKRAIVLAAGVVMNLVLAVVLFSTVYAIGARQVLDRLPENASVRDVETMIIGVVPDSPAADAGVLPGDVITEIDGQAFPDPEAASAYIRERLGAPLAVVVERGSERLERVITPGPLPGTEQQGLGVQLVETGIVQYPIHLAITQGIATTWFVMTEIVRALGQLVAGLVTDRAVSVDIAGPVGIAVMTGQVAQLGIIHLLQFMAVLSANLAFINIVPFPALDGGRLFLLAIEALRRRALAVRVEQIIHTIGFAVLIGLVLLVTYRDLATFGGGIMAALRNAIGM